MVLMKAANKEAATRPNKPDGSSESIAGYARSCPTLSSAMAGNACLKASKSGNTTMDAKATKIQGHGRRA